MWVVDWCVSRLDKGDLLLLSDHFDSMQYSWESVDLPITCHPSPSLITFAFSSDEVRCLLLDWTFVVSLTYWVFFLFFVRELQMLWTSVFVQCCGGLFVRVVSMLTGDRLMLDRHKTSKSNVTPIPKVHRPPLLPINDRFLYLQCCLWC